MKQPGIPLATESQVGKFCRVAEVRRILMSMKAALPGAARGCVAVTSTTPEEGTVFWITVPLKWESSDD